MAFAKLVTRTIDPAWACAECGASSLLTVWDIYDDRETHADHPVPCDRLCARSCSIDDAHMAPPRPASEPTAA